MAYVRVTETLKDDVQRNIYAMKNRAMDPVTLREPEQGTGAYNDFVELAAAAAWAEAPELREKLPRNWLPDNAAVRIRVSSASGDKNFSVSFSVPVDQKRFPPNISDRTYNPFTAAVGYAALPAHAQRFADNEFSNQVERRIIDERFESVRLSIRKFLDAVPSLNAALKEMPELAMYIPDGYMQKVHEKVERKKTENRAAEALGSAGLDVDELTSLAVAHRVVTARG